MKEECVILSTRLRQKHRAGCRENVIGTEVNSTVIVLESSRPQSLACKVGIPDEEQWR
jgi:hypothetical protein